MRSHRSAALGGDTTVPIMTTPSSDEKRNPAGRIPALSKLEDSFSLLLMKSCLRNSVLRERSSKVWTCHVARGRNRQTRTNGSRPIASATRFTSWISTAPGKKAISAPFGQQAFLSSNPSPFPLFKQCGEAFEWTAWLFELGICLVAGLSLPVLAAWKALPGALISVGVLKTIR